MWFRSTRKARRPFRALPTPFRSRLQALEDRTTPSVYTVTNITDTADTTAPDYVGSLRWAITQANTAAGADTIAFALPDALKSPGDWWTIAPQSLLPALTDSVVIDGWSQAGAGLGIAPRIMLDGSDAPAGVTTFGLQVQGDNCTIRGLAIGHFGGGLAMAIHWPSAGTTIQGCYVGVDPTGTTAAANALGIFDVGRFTTIGGASPGRATSSAGTPPGSTRSATA
jgi:hypothetical protein